MWQDWVLSVIQIVFIVALVPTMLHENKKPTLSTAVMITLGVATASFVYFTLALWGSCVATFIHALQWAIIAYQRRKLDMMEKAPADA